MAERKEAIFLFNDIHKSSFLLLCPHTRFSLYPPPPCTDMRLSKCIIIYKHIKNLYLFYVPVDKVCQFLLFLSTSDILPISIFNLQNNVSNHAYTLTYTHVPTRTNLHTRTGERAQRNARAKILLRHQRHENVSLHNALFTNRQMFPQFVKRKIFHRF